MKAATKLSMQIRLIDGILALVMLLLPTSYKIQGKMFLQTSKKLAQSIRIFEPKIG